MRRLLAILFVCSLQSFAFSQDMRALVEQYVADRGSVSRLFPYRLGHEARNRIGPFYGDWLRQLSSVKFEGLDQEARADYVLLVNHIRREKRRQELEAGKYYHEVHGALVVVDEITILEEERRYLLPIDAAKTAGKLNGLRKKVESMRNSVDPSSGPQMKQSAAYRASVLLGDLRNVLKKWYEFYAGYDPTFTWWNEEPYKALDAELASYAALVREKLAKLKPNDTTTIIGDPIGREALMAELQYEMIPYTPDELVEIANKEFAWCEKEMLRASRDLGYGDDWKKALEHVKQQYVEPGKQPQIVKDLAIEAIAFVEKNNLVTVPELAKETWRMEMMSPQQQLVSPFFLGGEVIQVAFPTNAMAHEAKLMSLRGNNIHFARATVHHELIPGHHLQGFMTDRYRPYRQLFGTPFWGEGWALVLGDAALG